MESHIAGLGHVRVHANLYYIYGRDRIYKFTQATDPELIATLPNGNIGKIVIHDGYAYCAVNFGKSLYKVDLATGEYKVITDKLNYPADLAIAFVDSDGRSK